MLETLMGKGEKLSKNGMNLLGSHQKATVKTPYMDEPPITPDGDVRKAVDE
jgi:hypothetical protein